MIDKKERDKILSKFEISEVERYENMIDEGEISLEDILSEFSSAKTAENAKKPAEKQENSVKQERIPKKDIEAPQKNLNITIDDVPDFQGAVELLLDDEKDEKTKAETEAQAQRTALIRSLFGNTTMSLKKATGRVMKKITKEDVIDQRNKRFQFTDEELEDEVEDEVLSDNTNNDETEELPREVYVPFEEYTKDSDTEKIRKTISARVDFINTRTAFVGLVAGIMVILTLLPIFTAIDPFLYLDNLFGVGIPTLTKAAVLLTLTIAAAIVSIDILYSAIIRIFKFRLNWETWALAALVATVIQNIQCLITYTGTDSNWIFSNLPVVLMLFFALNTKRLRLICVQDAFLIVASPMQKYAATIISEDRFMESMREEYVDENLDVCAVNKIDFVDNFFEKVYSPFMNEKYSNILTPIVLLVLGLTITAYALITGIDTTSTIIATLLCFTAPVALGNAGTLPAYILSKKLRRYKAAILGNVAMNDFSYIGGFVLNDNDIFTSGTVKLSGMKILGGVQIYEVVEAVAAMLTAANSCMAPPFVEMISGKSIKFEKVDVLEYEEGVGIKGKYKDSWYLIGNRELMRLHNVWVSPDKYENIFANKDAQALFVSCNGAISAVFGVKYCGSRNVSETLKRVIRNLQFIFVNAKGPHISDELICTKQRCPTGHITLLNKIVSSKIETQIANREINAKVISLNPLGIVNGVAVCEKMKYSIQLNTYIQVASSVIALILSLIMLFSGSIASVKPEHIVLFYFLWYFVIKIVSHTLNK